VLFRSTGALRQRVIIMSLVIEEVK
jgi:hypothetical protein